MDPVSIIIIIVTIAGFLASSGATLDSLALQSLNTQARSAIMTIIKDFNSEVKARRLNVNKLLSLLQSKNGNALLNYVYQNPLISKSLDAIKKDSEVLSQLQAEQASLESEIANIQSELNSYGYTQKRGFLNKYTKEEESRIYDAKRRLDKANSKYDELANKAAAADPTDSAIAVKPHTADLDAMSQNLTGGIKQ